MPAPGIFFAFSPSGVEHFYFVVQTLGDPELHVGVRIGDGATAVAVGYSAIMPSAGGPLYDAMLARLTPSSTGEHNHLLCDHAVSVAVGDVAVAAGRLQQGGLPDLYGYLETFL